MAKKESKHHYRYGSDLTNISTLTNDPLATYNSGRRTTKKGQSQMTVLFLCLAVRPQVSYAALRIAPYN